MSQRKNTQRCFLSSGADWNGCFYVGWTDRGQPDLVTQCETETTQKIASFSAESLPTCPQCVIYISDISGRHLYPLTLQLIDKCDLDWKEEWKTPTSVHICEVTISHQVFKETTHKLMVYLWKHHIWIFMLQNVLFFFCFFKWKSSSFSRGSVSSASKTLRIVIERKEMFPHTDLSWDRFEFQCAFHAVFSSTADLLPWWTREENSCNTFSPLNNTSCSHPDETMYI